MTLKELLSITLASDIYVSTENHDHYYSTDGGVTFRASCFNTDPDLTKALHERKVKHFNAMYEACIEISIE